MNSGQKIVQAYTGDSYGYNLNYDYRISPPQITFPEYDSLLFHGMNNISWTPVYGANKYIVAILDQTTGIKISNDISVYGTSLPIYLEGGHTYKIAIGAWKSENNQSWSVSYIDGNNIFSNFVQFQSAGGNVASLQNKLNNVGLGVGQVDGLFGDRTATAVLAVQKLYNLREDAVVGKNTLNAINTISRDLRVGNISYYEMNEAFNDARDDWNFRKQELNEQKQFIEEFVNKNGYVPNISLSVYQVDKSWQVLVHNGDDSTRTFKHVHVKNKNGEQWSQNEDGSIHDEGKNSPGDPPKWVKKWLKDKLGWDWDEKKANAEKEKNSKAQSGNNIVYGPIYTPQPNYNSSSDVIVRVGGGMVIVGGIVVATGIILDDGTIVGIADDGPGLTAAGAMIKYGWQMMAY